MSIEGATVKIRSQYLDQTVVLQGSGLGFRWQGESYVLTSDHVILFDSEEAEQEVQFASGKILSAEVVVTDFGHGLALLKMTNRPEEWPPDLEWPELDLLKTAAAQNRQPVVMMGYPALADGGYDPGGLVRDTGGTVTDAHQSNYLHVQIGEMIMVDHGYAEFGMSGGVATDVNDQFLGILSHQTFRSGETEIQNSIQVIPARLAVAWVKSILVDHVVPSLIQTPVQMLDRRSINFLSGKLYFTEVDPYSNGRQMVTLSSYEGGNDSYFGGPESETARLGEFLNQNLDCGVYIHGFRKRGHVGYDYSAGGWVSVLFSLAKPELEPIAEAWCNGTEDAVNSLDDQYKSLSHLIGEAQDVGAYDLLSVLSRYLENYVRDQDFYDPENNSYFVLKPSDLRNLLSAPEYQDSWKKLEQHGKRSALQKGIQDLAETFKYLSI